MTNPTARDTKWGRPLDLTGPQSSVVTGQHTGTGKGVRKFARRSSQETPIPHSNIAENPRNWRNWIQILSYQNVRERKTSHHFVSDYGGFIFTVNLNKSRLTMEMPLRMSIRVFPGKFNHSLPQSYQRMQRQLLHVPATMDCAFKLWAK